MTLAKEGCDLSSINSVGAAAEAEAAGLTQAVLREAAIAASDHTLAKMVQSLEDISRLGQFGKAADVSAKTLQLASCGRTRVLALDELLLRLEPLRAGLDLDICRLRLLATNPDISSGGITDFESDISRTAVDRRLLRLETVGRSIDQGAVILRLLLSAERFQEDQLSLLAEVTAPAAIRAASLSWLASEASRIERLAAATAETFNQRLSRDVDCFRRSPTAPAGSSSGRTASLKINIIGLASKLRWI